jgi:hypothetical protein
MGPVQETLHLLHQDQHFLVDLGDLRLKATPLRWLYG